MAEECVGRLIATRGDGDGARAEVAGAGDVVGRVADDDELVGVEVSVQVTADALASDRREVASVVREFAECAGQTEELFEPDQP